MLSKLQAASHNREHGFLRPRPGFWIAELAEFEKGRNQGLLTYIVGVMMGGDGRSKFDGGAEEF